MTDMSKLLANSIPSFRFLVMVDKEAFGVFTECKLPAIEWETEDIKEGGMNTFTYQLPGRRKPGRVSLSNGVGRSPFMDWYLKTMEEKIERRAVTITLLNLERSSVIEWHISDAFPVKWDGPQLKSGDNSIAVQNLELACGEIVVVRGGE